MSENIKRFPEDFDELQGALEPTDVIIVAKIGGKSYKVKVDKIAAAASGGGSLIISATAPIGTDGTEWLSTNTGIRYTFLNNKWVEV